MKVIQCLCISLLILLILLVPGLMPLTESSSINFRKYSYLVNRFIFQKKEMVAINNTGTSFAFIPKDAVGRTIYKKGNYEPELSNFILHTINYSHDDIVIDVGANIGWYSILLAKLDAAPGQIYAFEPDTLNYNLLQRNIILNKSENITAIQAALSNHAGKSTLYKYNDNNLGRHSLLPINSQNKIEINTTTLDDFAKEYSLLHKKIKLVKIDVEGFEYFVLNGGKALLKNTEILIHEFSPNLMAQGNVPLDLLINELQSLEMKPFVIAGKSLQVVNKLEQVAEGQNIIWLAHESTLSKAF